MNTTREKGSLFVKIENRIATIEFGHPSGNSFPSELLIRLTQEINSLSHNSDVAVIILKSEGDSTFCAGASFDELITITNLKEGANFFSGFANVINAMRTCTKLIIGRVHGKTVGGGVGLAAACDYVLATERASIKLSELTIGIGPFVIEPVINRKIGLSGFSELSLSPSEWKNAYWAKDKGLFNNVFETTKELDLAINLLTEEFASYNPDALLEMKKILWKDTDHWANLLKERATISGKLVLSKFTKLALEKFKRAT